MAEMVDAPIEDSGEDVVEDGLNKITYKPILVYSQLMESTNLDPLILERLSAIHSPLAVKGGFARELFKLHLGIIEKCDFSKLEDLDIVVFENKSEVKEERIARRDEIAAMSNNLEAKDIEICDATPLGLLDFFKTRDVTMNELVMFREGDNFRFFYSEECIQDLTKRTIRPSIHSGHTGLIPVWRREDESRVLSPEVIARCIYRKVKGDGDTFVFDEIDLKLSVNNLTVDNLFKIIKRFTNNPTYFVETIKVFEELGVDESKIDELVRRVGDTPLKKSKPSITSAVVEELLEERETEYQLWLRNASEEEKIEAEVSIALF